MTPDDITSLVNDCSFCGRVSEPGEEVHGARLDSLRVFSKLYAAGIEHRVCLECVKMFQPHQDALLRFSEVVRIQHIAGTLPVQRVLHETP